jgi:hypothetical protein
MPCCRGIGIRSLHDDILVAVEEVLIMEALPTTPGLPPADPPAATTRNRPAPTLAATGGRDWGSTPRWAPLDVRCEAWRAIREARRALIARLR